LASVADKLVVSNLAVTVTQNDVKELFARIGPVKSAQLNYDSNGKSKGVANVTFVKAGDAQKAFNEYHNRPLDNKPMKIELIINPDSAKLKHLTKPVLGQKPGAGVGKPKRKPKPKNQRKDMSAMDLDAEMESYMNDNVFQFDCRQLLLLLMLWLNKVLRLMWVS
jgi:THO complex subunit 4